MSDAITIIYMMIISPFLILQGIVNLLVDGEWGM
jgi:hypothetical protein